MALTMEWESVKERFKDLAKHPGLRPTVEKMQWLVGRLCEDPRMDGVAPHVSLGSLSLKPVDSKRSVMIAWNENEPGGYKVSYVDPPLEISETTRAPEAAVITVIMQYLDRLRANQ